MGVHCFSCFGCVECGVLVGVRGGVGVDRGVCGSCVLVSCVSEAAVEGSVGGEEVVFFETGEDAVRFT